MVAPEQVSSTVSLFTPAVQDSPLSIQETFIELYERVNPSVVNVQVTYTPDVTELNDEFTPYFPQLPGFPENAPEFGPPMSILPQQSQGSGFVYDKEGHIVTNSHVVHDANEITVTFANGTNAPATLVGSDPDSDLAVVKVEVDSDLLQPVTIGDSDSLKVGQFVAAIGNPFGLDGSMTTGIISGLGRLLPAAERARRVQYTRHYPDGCSYQSW
jgi:S1-C subfamily serine protease